MIDRAQNLNLGGCLLVWFHSEKESERKLAKESKTKKHDLFGSPGFSGSVAELFSRFLPWGSVCYTQGPTVSLLSWSLIYDAIPGVKYLEVQYMSALKNKSWNKNQFFFKWTFWQCFCAALTSVRRHLVSLLSFCCHNAVHM